MATQSAWARRRSSSVPEFDYERARYCSRCGQPIVVADAQFCKECGAPLAGTRIFVANPGFNPIVAAVLSFIPGLGHLYKGRLGRAVLWFFSVTIAYAISFPLGMLLHMVCAANAALKGVIQEDAIEHIRRSRRRSRRGASPSFEGEP